MKSIKDVVQPFMSIFIMIGILSLCTANMVLAQSGGSVAGKDLVEEVNILEKDLEELSERLDEVETKTLIDKISIGAELRTRFDWYHFEDNDLDDRDSVNLLPSNRFRLNLKADVSENLKFHSRLVVYKNWMDDSMTTSMDMHASRTPTDTTVKAERAYVDYFFKGLPLALTFGRLPFTDGLPTDLKENTTRKSTYPSLAYDVEGDGIALSYGLKDLIHLPDSAVRLIYLKMLIRDDDAELWEDDALGIDDQNIYLFQFETGFPGTMEDCLFIANIVYLPDVSSPGDLSGQGLTAVDLPDSLGSMTKATFFFESKRFLGSPVDWFVGYSYMTTDAEGGALYDAGAPFPITIGLLNDDGTSDRSASAFQLGLRYNLPIECLNEPKLGIEYNRGSKYWMGMNLGSEDPLHKLGVAGNAWDFYYIQPIDRYFTIRVGHTMVEYDYENPALYYGSPTDVDKEITNTYVLLDVKF